jgi:phosphatidylglycerol---prolipoprotein diacylglyceryl transferase
MLATLWPAERLPMYPTLFRIGDFEVTSFGALVALAALVGLWMYRRELMRSGLPESGVDAALAGVLGGLLGAKLLWTFEHLDEGRFVDLFFSRGGMSWFGGFVGGVAAGLVMMRRRGMRVLPALAAATPALAIGHAIGRVGCFLVGDDYGRPTDLPWGIAFPEGLPPTDVPVHPTQLYEAVMLVPIAWMLQRWRRRALSDRVVLGAYLIMTGVLRFAIEFIRVNERVLGPLTVAHLVALAVVVVGLALLTARPASRTA